MTHTLSARRLVTDSSVVDFPVITLSPDGSISRIDTDSSIAHADDTLTAASLDIHTHGALGHDVMSASPKDLAAMQRFLAQHGVAHYLPTTVTASIEATLYALDRLAEAVETAVTSHPGNEARPIGIHLEGPFLSHSKRGVHPAHQLQEPTLELFDRFWQASRGLISLVTVAPELPGALDFIAYATALGVRTSIGHSNSTAAEARAAIAAGASSATHTFNAMRPLDHREPGILGVTLDDRTLFAELICDGIHVAPELIRLWLRSKGRDRAILVTDAMSAAGMPDGAYSLAGLAVTVANGRAALTEDPETLAGSVLTMDAAISNLHRFTGASLADSSRLASHNPAALLDQRQLTAVSPGAPAHLNRLDPHGHLLTTYLHGQQIAR
jgi:N-acetylglucosamine-6-phosphate deacetylase